MTYFIQINSLVEWLISVLQDLGGQRILSLLDDRQPRNKDTTSPMRDTILAWGKDRALVLSATENPSVRSRANPFGYTPDSALILLPHREPQRSWGTIECHMILLWFCYHTESPSEADPRSGAVWFCSDSSTKQRAPAHSAPIWPNIGINSISPEQKFTDIWMTTLWKAVHKAKLVK